MDTSAWKMDDPAWVEQRRSVWPEFLEFVKSHFNEAAHPDEHLRRAEDYYFRGVMEGDYRDGVSCLYNIDYFAMHPALDLVSARKIIDFYDDVGYGVRGYFFNYYLAPRSFYRLIGKGLVSESIGKVIIEAYYGRGYLEAAGLRGFEPEEDAYRTASNLLHELSQWLSPPEEYMWFPAKQLIPFAIGALEFSRPEEIQNDSYDIMSLAKRMARLDEKSKQNFPGLAEFVAEFRQAMEASSVIDEVKQLFRGGNVRILL